MSDMIPTLRPAVERRRPRLGREFVIGAMVALGAASLGFFAIHGMRHCPTTVVKVVPSENPPMVVTPAFDPNAVARRFEASAPLFRQCGWVGLRHGQRPQAFVLDITVDHGSTAAEARGVAGYQSWCVVTIVRQWRFPDSDMVARFAFEVPAPDLSPAQILIEARQALLDGDYAQSLYLADETLHLAPGSQEAISLAALSACKMGDLKRADRYIDDLAGQRKQLLRQECASRPRR